MPCKFCRAVHRRPRQGISHFCELCFPWSPKSDELANAWRPMNVRVAIGWRSRRAYQVCVECGRSIGMCGYTSVPDDGRTCQKYVGLDIFPLLLGPSGGRGDRSYATVHFDSSVADWCQVGGQRMPSDQPCLLQCGSDQSCRHKKCCIVPANNS